MVLSTMNKQEVFAQVLEKYKEEEVCYLDNMSIDELCNLRATISKQLKKLESERQAIDEDIMNYLSDAELRRGIHLKTGELLKSRTRKTYKYPDEVGLTINELRRRSRELGEAEEVTTSYLVVVNG